MVQDLWDCAIAMGDMSRERAFSGPHRPCHMWEEARQRSTFGSYAMAASASTLADGSGRPTR
jgi:hypothetical protein